MSAPNFKQAIHGSAKLIPIHSDNSLAAATTEQLLAEKWKRENFMVFPIDVFPAKFQPFLSELMSQMNIPREFVGATTLAACSAAIGSAYVGVSPTKRYSLPVWVANVGETSSGKSLVVDKVMDVFFEIDAELAKANSSEYAAIQNESQMDGSEVSDDDYQEKKIIFQTGTFQSLVQRTLRYNPKGVMILKDEMVDLFEEFGKKGYEQYENFLLQSWSNSRPYKFEKLSRSRAIIVPRTFANVVGGTQLKLINNFFAKNRDSSGFSARFLFAIDKANKVLVPKEGFFPNPAYKADFDEVIKNLYYQLNVDLIYKGLDATAPHEARLSREANRYHNQWWIRHAEIAESLADDDIIQRETYKAALGKLNEYAVRLATILKITYVAADADYAPSLKDIKEVDIRYMEMGCRLADYFMASYFEAFAYGNRSALPLDAQLVLSMMKSGKSKKVISAAMQEYFPKGSWSVGSLHNKCLSWMRKYPKEFGSVK
jgi:hypothetical protein